MEQWDEVEWLVEADASPAEGPLWDAARGVVWWVDIMGERLHRYDPSSGRDDDVAVGQPIGAVALCADGALLLAVQRGLARFDPSTGAVVPFVDIEATDSRTRANDGKAGPDGAFWGGTMAIDATPGCGGFYRVDARGRVQQLLAGVSISNGLDWLTDDRLYYVDSFAYGIDLLDVDRDAGVVVRRQRFIDVPEAAGLVDGLCLDADEHVWVALHGAGEVRRYAPDGALVGRVVVPAPLTTCCAFGGPDLTDLYITAAASDAGPGGLLRCRPGATGRVPYRFAG